MREVSERLYVGTQADYERLVKPAILSGEWAVVQACKDPYHREAVGYSGRGAPKEHPEYLYAARPNRLILNLVDTDDPAYVPARVIEAAISFMIQAHETGRKVFIHCNQGRSRSPTIAMLFLAHWLPGDFARAEQQMLQMYPEYLPANGMRSFAKANWSRYQSFVLEEGMA